MNENGKDNVERIGGFYYFIGALSFIPVFGVINGLVCAVYGLFTKKKGGKVLMLIGLAGIMVTVSIYGSIFYFLKSDDFFPEIEETFEEFGQNSLNQAVPVLEYYKLQHDKYPETLSDLENENYAVLTSFLDADLMKPLGGLQGGEVKDFYYAPVQGGYLLLGRGEDRLAGTEDDMFPQVVNREKMGLKLPKEVEGHVFKEEEVSEECETEVDSDKKEE